MFQPFGKKKGSTKDLQSPISEPEQDPLSSLAVPLFPSAKPSIDFSAGLFTTSTKSPKSGQSSIASFHSTSEPINMSGQGDPLAIKNDNQKPLVPGDQINPLIQGVTFPDQQTAKPPNPMLQAPNPQGLSMDNMAAFLAAQQFFQQQFNAVDPSIPKLPDEFNFSDVVAGRYEQQRDPKNMVTTYNAFINLCVEGDPENPAGFTREWIKMSYNTFVLAAKGTKKNMNAGVKTKKLFGPDGELKIIVKTGSEGVGIRSDVSTVPIVLTYPDFCACLSLVAYWQSFATDLPAAPLGAAIKCTLPGFEKWGWHVFMHSGFASVANYFCRRLIDEINEADDPPLGFFSCAAILMDQMATGKTAGTNNNLEAVMRTCPVSEDLLAEGCDFNSIGIVGGATNAGRKATSIRAKLLGVSSKLAGIPTTSGIGRGGLAGRGGRGGRGGAGRGGGRGTTV